MKKILVLLLVLCPILSVLSQDVYQKADELLTAYSRLGRFNGSALITQHGKVLWKKGMALRILKQGLSTIPIPFLKLPLLPNSLPPH